MPKSYALGLFSLLCACEKEALAPLLTERPSFAGEILIERLSSGAKPPDSTATGDAIRGDLAFDRQHDNLQWTVRESKAGIATATTVMRAADGKLRCFVNAEPGELRPELEQSFVIIEAIIRRQKSAATVADRSAESYTVEIEKDRYRITATERAVLRGH